MQGLDELRALDLNHLVTLVALAEARSVTQAGQRLGLSQPAVSHVLRHLRRHFDDPLFVRIGREMLPTPRAEALLGPVRQALALLSSAVSDPDGFSPATSARTFRLVSIDLFERLVAPRLLATLSAQAPGCALVFLAAGPDTLAALERGELDAVVRPVLPGVAPAPSAGPIRQRALLREGLLTFVRAGHPLADAAAVDLDRWCAAPHLLVSPSGEGPGPVDLALAALGRQRRVAARLPAFAAALDVVAATDLVLSAPASLARLAGPGVATLPVPVEIPAHHLALLWSERADADPGARWLRERVVEAARSLQPPPAPASRGPVAQRGGVL